MSMRRWHGLEQFACEVISSSFPQITTDILRLEIDAVEDASVSSVRLRREWEVGHHFMGTGESKMVAPAVKQTVDSLIKSNKVMIFSKSSCPYCTMAKEVFKEIGEQFGLVELDRHKDGSSMQSYLAELTGARTVPRVFIKGNCIGGGSETKGLYNSGKLKSMLA